MRLHDPSLAAADPASSAWVTANAGSGKTHTLANRVTRLLLAGAGPERILCLTYTKAAAAEMQSRLFSRLGHFSMLPDTDLRAMLDDIGAPAMSDLPAARRLFAQALETPGGLKIQTIHGFCQSLLSRFPLEAAVAPGFRVFDEPAATNLMNEARLRVLDRAGGGEVLLAGALSRLVTEISEQRLEEILHSSLGTDRRKLTRYFSSPAIRAGLEAAVRRAHDIAQEETEAGLVERFCAQMRTELDALSEVAVWLESGLPTDREKALDLRRALSSPSPRSAFEHLRSAFVKSDGQRYQKLVTKSLATSNSPLLSYLEEFVQSLCTCDARRHAAHAAELCHAVLIVVSAVEAEYSSLKKERGGLDYDDLVLETRRLLEHSSAAQWVLFKLDGGIDHVLIDEAQDTSPEQWSIVQTLTDEFFAGVGARGDAVVRTIFVVGDEKQSIFSFQGAEPDQFERYRAYFESRALAAEHDFANEPLTISQRSTPEILAFVDEVFRPPAARAGLTSLDLIVEHRARRADAAGRVEFWPAIQPPDEPEPDPEREINRPLRASAGALLADRIASQVSDWLQHGTSLPARENPIRPADIMILLPRREPFGPLMIRALKQRNIAVAGADRMRLTDEIVVRDLMALGHFVLQPLDDLTLASVLRSPLCNIGEEDLLRLCVTRRDSLWNALREERDEMPSFQSAYRILSEMLALADYSPPFEFFSHALTALGMRRRLLERLGSESEDAIDEFLSLAFAHERTAAPSLQGWLNWLECGGAEIRRDMERVRDEVRVMTVHGAKGLEADIVFLPDTTSLPPPPSQRGQLLFAGESVFVPIGTSSRVPAIAAAREEAHRIALREHRRLLYVAMTRAKDRLYVCGFSNKTGIKEGSWYRLAEAAAMKLGRKIRRGDESVLVIGDGDDKKRGRPAAPRREVELPAWAVTPPREKPAPPLILRPTDTPGDIGPTAFGRSAREHVARTRGTLVHELLARLVDIAPESRREAALAFLRPKIDDDTERDSITSETLRVLTDPIFASAFGPGSKAEVSLTADLPEIGQQVRVSGRVDRLALGEEILVVDFKSDGRVPTGAEAIPSPYLAQMALYRAALSKIFPGRPVACALLWTREPSLMRIDEAVLDRQIADIRLRLDRTGTHS